jgi:hypothetical protein
MKRKNRELNQKIISLFPREIDYLSHNSRARKLSGRKQFAVSP